MIHADGWLAQTVAVMTGVGDEGPVQACPVPKLADGRLTSNFSRWLTLPCGTR
jgi:hypothetical protein